MTSPSENTLEDLRKRIDDVDRRLIELLNERAKVVVEVGAYKRESGAPIYAPDREASLLRKILETNPGPLPNRTIEAVYREMMSGSFALERPLRIGYLGPPGSYSHQAAVAQFGSSVSFEDLGAIEAVFAEVERGHADYGLVPIENTTGGGIAETLDAFRDSSPSLNIYAEAQLAIRHHLFAVCETDDIERVYSKPEALAQCRKWLRAHVPSADLMAEASTSAAVERVRVEATSGVKPTSAAVASELAGKIYGVAALYSGIEDNPNNITRFLVISREEAKPSGDDKTSIMFTTTDRPGALVRVLQVFDRSGVNLSHIEKRPSGRENWRYTFFIDVKGHRSEPRIAEAIGEARAHCEQLRTLGSYPQSTRIL
jgi:chorismate mutase / prephenate dehydratase